MRTNSYQQPSRRAFLGATAGAASLALAPRAGTAADSPERRSARSTVRDRFWIFTVPAGLDNPALAQGGVSGSRMTPAEGAFFLDVPNLLLIRSNELPPLPAEEPGRTITSFEQYAISFQPLDRVIWSLVGSGGQEDLDGIASLLPIAEKYPNLCGVFFDDFILDGDVMADGRRAGRPVRMPEQLRAAREALKAIKRPMELWVTLYNYDVVPSHPRNRVCDPPLADVLAQFDVLTLWTWNSDELRDLEQSLAGLEAAAPKTTRKALGIYLWDFTQDKPVPLDLMEYQCELGLKWLKEKRISEMIFLANTLADVGLPSAKFCRDWIAKVGSEPLEGRAPA